MERIRPAGRGWKPVISKMSFNYDSDAENSAFGLGLLCMVAGCVAVYSSLFATGYFIYGQMMMALIMAVIAALGAWFIYKSWDKLRF